MMVTDKKQIDNLTGIRAVASFWVVLFHFSYFNLIDNASLLRIVQIGGVGVDIFFVLSGFILSYTYTESHRKIRHDADDSKAFWSLFFIKRLARLYPMHVATLLAYVPMLIVADQMAYTINPAYAYDAYHTTLNLTMLHAWGVSEMPSWNAPSWSISAEWFAYLLLFPICLRLFDRYSIIWVVLTALITWLFNLWAVQNGIGMTYEGALLRITPLFLFGYIMFRLNTIMRVPPEWATPLTLVGIIALLTMPFIGRIYSVLPLVVMVLLFGLYTGSPIVNAVFGNGVMVFLGKISYAVYLVHMPLQSVTKFLVKRFPLLLDYPIGLTVVHMSVVVIIGTVGYAVIERPGRRIITIFYRNKTN
ncbi:MAG: acyltransferase [Magnetococcales bacterium]|nr:acyltransferase [Magnetococcales bacterium]